MNLITYEGVEDLDWPSHYPQDCPPEDARDAVGEIYRLVTKRELQDLPAGFLCHKLKVPKQSKDSDPCIVCGLSVSITYNDCICQRKLSPLLRKKKILFTILEEPLGKILNTSCVSPNHYTWWIPDCLKKPWDLFEVCEYGHE